MQPSKKQHPYQAYLDKMEAELETATGDELRKHFSQLSQDFHRLEMRRLKKEKDEADHALKRLWLDHRIAQGQAKATPATLPPAPELAFAKSPTHLPNQALPDEKPWPDGLMPKEQQEEHNEQQVPQTAPELPGQQASEDAGAFMERMWQDYHQRQNEAHRHLRHLANSRAGPRAIAW